MNGLERLEDRGLMKGCMSQSTLTKPSSLMMVCKGMHVLQAVCRGMHMLQADALIRTHKSFIIDLHGEQTGRRRSACLALSDGVGRSGTVDAAATVAHGLDIAGLDIAGGQLI